MGTDLLRTCCVGLALASVVGGTLNLAVASEGEGETLLWEDFEADEPGPVQLRLTGIQQADLVEGEGTGGSKALRVAYVGYDRGSERLVTGLPLGERLTEATLSFDVKFDKTFQFVRGGKLHGLGPASPVTGGHGMQAHRWSARLMWRGRGGLGTYLYIQNKQGRYGASRTADDFQFEKDRYYAISLHVRLNDPDKRNGFAHVYVDGERLIAHDDVQYRSVGGDETLIQQFLFSTFHGGSSPEWAPTDEQGDYTTVYACYDNFAVLAGGHVRAEPVDHSQQK